MICGNLTRPGSFISVFVSARRFQAIFFVPSDRPKRLSRGNVARVRGWGGKGVGQEKQMDSESGRQGQGGDSDRMKGACRADR